MEKNNEVENKVVKKDRMNIYVFSILMFVVFVATFYLIHVYLTGFLLLIYYIVLLLTTPSYT